MKITIITATWNSNLHVRNCLQSASNQTYANIEHIVVDGDSTDGTKEIIECFQSITKYISEPDNGIYDALNKGIKMATGDIIGFLHSDDQLNSSDTIKKIADLFEKTNADGVFGDLVFINDQNKIIRTWLSKPFKRKNVKFGWAPPHPALFFKKEVYQKHGLFDTSFKIAGDYDFMLRVMLDKEINLVYLPEVVTKMRMGGVSTGNLKQLITKSREDIKALRKNGFHSPALVLFAKFFRKVPQLLRK